MREQSLGPFHTSVAWAASWLGDNAHELHDEEAAGRYYERCASILASTFGADSSELAGAPARN